MKKSENEVKENKEMLEIENMSFEEASKIAATKSPKEIMEAYKN